MALELAAQRVEVLEDRAVHLGPVHPEVRLEEHDHPRRAPRRQRLRHELLQLLKDVAPVQLCEALVQRVAEPLLLKQNVADGRAAVLVHVAVDEDRALLGAGALVGGQRRVRVVPPHRQRRQATLRRPRKPHTVGTRGAALILRVWQRVARLPGSPPGLHHVPPRLRLLVSLIQGGGGVVPAPIGAALMHGEMIVLDVVPVPEQAAVEAAAEVDWRPECERRVVGARSGCSDQSLVGLCVVRLLTSCKKRRPVGHAARCSGGGHLLIDHRLVPCSVRPIGDAKHGPRGRARVAEDHEPNVEELHVVRKGGHIAPKKVAGRERRHGHPVGVDGEHAEAKAEQAHPQQHLEVARESPTKVPARTAADATLTEADSHGNGPQVEEL